MKWFLIVGVLLQGVVLGMEVRSYGVGKELFLRVYHQNLPRDLEADPFAEGADGSVSEPLGLVLEGAPFVSRFFAGVESFWGCSEEMGELLGEKDWKGMAVVDEESGRLVVKAEARDHREIAEVFEGELGGQIETVILVHAMAGAGPWELEEVEKEGQLLGVLSCLHLSGQAFEARSDDGKLVVKGEVHIDRDWELMESRVEWESQIPGGEFDLKTGLATVRGEPLVMELGSRNGKRSLVAVLVQDRVLWNGVKFDEWILKEEGGAFLKEERRAGGDTQLAEGDELRRFSVPPSFIDFITVTSGGGGEADDDPFATGVGSEKKVNKAEFLYEGDHPELARVPRHKLYDVTNLLRQNGVSFREGDFAIFMEKSSTLLVKASETNMELVHGIVCAGGPSYPLMVRLDFSLVEADGEVDRGRLEKGDFELKGKIGLEVFPGQVGTVGLRKGLMLEAEAQIDGNDDMIDIRVTLARGGDLAKADFKTGAVLRAGVPVVVQQSRVGEKWRAWVATARVITVGEPENLE